MQLVGAAIPLAWPGERAVDVQVPAVETRRCRSPVVVGGYGGCIVIIVVVAALLMDVVNPVLVGEGRSRTHGC